MATAQQPVEPRTRYCADCQHEHQDGAAHACLCPECGKPADEPGGTCGRPACVR